MNLVKQFREFGVLNSINPLPGHAQLLYYNLLQAFNSNRWVRKLIVRTQILETQSGMTRKQLAVARNTLIQRGLIKYYPAKQASGSPTYEIIPLYDEAGGANPYSPSFPVPVFPPETHRGTQEGTHRGTQNGQEGEHLYKLNETEQNKTEEGAPEGTPPPTDDLGKKKNEKGKRRVAPPPPTAEDMKTFLLDWCKTFWTVEQTERVATECFLHYEANGWVQNKGKPIMNWKAAAQKWVGRERSGDFKPHKSATQFEQSAEPETKTEAMLMQELETFFAAYQKKDSRSIKLQPAHYDLLKRMGLTRLPPGSLDTIKAKAIAKRMEQLGGNNHSDLELQSAYDRLTKTGESSPLVDADQDNLLWIIRRLCILQLFHGKQHCKQFFETEPV